MVDMDQSSNGIYVAFVSESDQAMARIASFEIDNSFYVNNKSSDEKEIFFYWDVNGGFLLINKAIEKMDKTKET